MGFKPEVVPIADCKPYQSGDAKNYRKHPPAQVEELAKSLEAFGQYKNIVISSDGFILAGEGVWRAAQARGEESIAAIRMPFDADDPRAAKLLVADNELSRLAEDDETQLVDLLKGLQETVGLEGTGHDDGTLQELLEGLAAQDVTPPVEDPGPGEPLVEPITKPGDVWVMGEHRLVCGDAVDPAAYADDLQAQCVVTSPPYATQRTYELTEFDWDKVVPLAIATAAKHVTPDGSILVNLGLVHEGGRVIEYWRPLFDMMDAQDRPLFGWYVWDKQYGLPGDWNGRLAPAHEWVFHFAHKPRRPNKTHESKRAGEKIQGTGMRRADGSMSGMTGFGEEIQPFKIPDSVIRCAPAKGGVDGHPAPFSPAFAGELLEPYVRLGETCIDCFAGSGTTIIAAEQLGRVCYGIEIEPRYCDVAVRRWQTATGKTAILESTEAAFPGE